MVFARTMALVAGSLTLAGATVTAQEFRQQDAYHAMLNGVAVRVTAATDPGLQIDAGKPPDHVHLAPLLPEAAAAWADSGVRLLDAPDTSPTAHAATLSSAMLVDSAHNAVSIDRVLSDSAPHCSIFFTDAANKNHVRADVPCTMARQFLAGLAHAAALQATYDRAQAASPAAVADAQSRVEIRRQDSLATAAQTQMRRYHDSAAGAIP